MEIARRAGARLCLDDLSEAELRAAETLARHLVADAVERVRAALSDAVKSALHLPRDVALKIAHDVDAVACPFLQATDVFSEEDWQQLVLTVSRGGRVAVASRPAMSEGVAVALAELGDSVVAQALVENPAAPMTPPVCDTIIERFEETGWVLDTLAGRDDLLAETASQLITKVSSVLRERLIRTYGVSEHATKLASEAEIGALLDLIRNVPPPRLTEFVKHLRSRRQLSYTLMLEALRDGSLQFFTAAVSELAKLPADKVGYVLDEGSDGVLTGLLSRVEIPKDIYAEIWSELKRRRARGETASPKSGVTRPLAG